MNFAHLESPLFAIPRIAIADVECGCKIVQSVAVNALNGSMWNSVGDTPEGGNDIIRSCYSNRVFSHVKRVLFRNTSTFVRTEVTIMTIVVAVLRGKSTTQLQLLQDAFIRFQPQSVTQKLLRSAS